MANGVFIHPTAIVDDGATLGAETKVWHFSHVMSGAVIGARCSLGQGVFVGGRVRVGDGVRVQNNVSIFDGVEIGDDAFLGPSCVFTNVTNPRSFVKRKSEFRTTIVGRGASIGANATIVCGHRVGDYAFVGAGAVVTRDVADFSLVVGNPARRVGWMCRCGVRLADREAPICASCGASYHWSDGLLSAGAVAENSHIPLLDLAAQHAPLEAGLRSAFERVFRSSHFIMGPEVLAFENEVSTYLDGVEAIGMSSGTDALLVALMALDVGPGDEVIVPTYSFFATAGVVSRVGAIPVFVDVDPQTFCMTADGFRAAITTRTKAVIPVHLFGDLAPVREIAAEARRHGVRVIEDAAQALGARVAGVPAGAIGDFGCFSFFPSKNLGALGDAGLLVTRDGALAARARRLRVHGAEPKYFNAEIGGNFRLDALQAAFLRVKLPHLDEWTARRRANADVYDRQFARAGLEGLRAPRRSEHAVVNQYTVLLSRRDEVQRALKSRGIATEVYYPRPLHLQECYRHLGVVEGMLPNAERLARTALSLPVFAEITRAELERVSNAVIECVRQATGDC